MLFGKDDIEEIDSLAEAKQQMKKEYGWNQQKLRLQAAARREYEKAKLEITEEKEKEHAI